MLWRVGRAANTTRQGALGPDAAFAVREHGVYYHSLCSASSLSGNDLLYLEPYDVDELGSKAAMVREGQVAQLPLLAGTSRTRLWSSVVCPALDRAGPGKRRRPVLTVLALDNDAAVIRQPLSPYMP